MHPLLIIVLEANSIFPLPYKLPTPIVSWTSSYRRILQIDDVLISCDNCNLVSIQFSRLKAWKLLHRYLNCNDILINILIGTYLWFIIKWLEWFFELCPFLLWLRNLIFIWLIKHWACKLMGYTWLYRGHGWFWFLYDVILIIISSWLIDFMKSLVAMFYELWLCKKRMGHIWVWFHIEWQCLIIHMARWWNIWILCWFWMILWRIDIMYGVSFTLINGTLVWLSTAQISGWPINVV